MEYLKKLRTKQDITQKQLAEELGISTSHYTKVEIGDRRPSFEMIRKLKVFYGKEMDTNELFK